MPTIIHTTPSSQTTSENTPLTFSVGSGNEIATNISDASGNSTDFEVTISSTNGDLSLATTEGLVISDPSGNVTSTTKNDTFTFSSCEDQINVALDGLVYCPNMGFKGIAEVTLFTSVKLSNTTIQYNFLNQNGVSLSTTNTTNDTITANNQANISGACSVTDIKLTSDPLTTFTATNEFLINSWTIGSNVYMGFISNLYSASQANYDTTYPNVALKIGGFQGGSSNDVLTYKDSSGSQSSYTLTSSTQSGSSASGVKYTFDIDANKNLTIDKYTPAIYLGTTTYVTFETGTNLNTIDSYFVDITESNNLYDIGLRSTSSTTTNRYGAKSSAFRPSDYDSMEFIFNVRRFYGNNLNIGFVKKVSPDFDMNAGYNIVDYRSDVFNLHVSPDAFLVIQAGPGGITVNNGSRNIAVSSTNTDYSSYPGYRFIFNSSNGDYTIEYRPSKTNTWSSSGFGTFNLTPGDEWYFLVCDNSTTESNFRVEMIGTLLTSSTTYVAFDSTGNFSISTPYARYATISNPSTNLWNVKTFWSDGYNPTTFRYGARTRTADSFRFADYSEVRATFTINEWSERNMYLGFLVSGRNISFNIDMNNSVGYDCYFIDLNTMNNDPDNFNSKNTDSNFVIPLTTNIQYPQYPTTAGDKYRIRVATDGSVGIDFYQNSTSTWTNNVQSITIPNLPTTTDFDVFVWDNNGTLSKADIDIFVEKIATGTPAWTPATTQRIFDSATSSPPFTMDNSNYRVFTTDNSSSISSNYDITITVPTTYVAFDSIGDFTSSLSFPYARYATISNPGTTPNLWNVKTYDGSSNSATARIWGARTRTADSFKFGDYAEVRATFTINQWSERNMYIGFLISGKPIYYPLDMNNAVGYNCYFIGLNTINEDPDNFISKNTSSDYSVPLTTNIQYPTTAGDKYRIRVTNNGCVGIDFYNTSTSTWNNNVQTATIPNLPTTTDFDVMVWDNNTTLSYADIDVFVEKITAPSTVNTLTETSTVQINVTNPLRNRVIITS